MHSGTERNPEQERFLSQIPSLTRTALTGGERQRATAIARLTDGVRQDPAYDPVLFAIQETQQVVKFERGSSRVIKRAKELISTVTAPEVATQSIINLDDPRIMSCIDGIIATDRVMRASLVLYGMLPSIYEHFVDKTLPYAKSIGERGTTKLVLHRAYAGQFEDAERIAREHNNWEIKLNGLLDDSERIMRDPDVKDNYIDLLKNEPDAKQVGHERVWETKFAGINLVDIENMEYPLSKEDFIKVTHYVIAALSPTQQETPYALEIRQDRITKLFMMGATIFHKEFVPADIRNRRVLANINSWQEELLICLVTEGDPEIEQGLKDFLTAAPKTVGYLLMHDLQSWAVRPYIFDPDYSQAKRNYTQIVSRHPLMMFAIENMPFFADGSNSFVHGDDIGYRFFRKVLTHTFKERVAELGYGEKFKEELEKVEAIYREDMLKEQHIAEIKRSFEYICGPDFFDRLNIHAAELSAVTASSWNSLFEQIRLRNPSAPMHYLPMQQGLNVIEFSDGSVPWIMGFRNLRVNRMGTAQQWEIALEFGPKTGGMTIIGKLDMDGVLHLNDPIREQISSLYTALSLIGTLAFHDLVVQEEAAEKEGRPRTKSPPQIGKTPREEEKTGDQEDRPEFEIYRSYGRLLPRRQTDKELIGSVYKHRGFTSRIVEIHRMWLPGKDEYLTAIDQYNEAQANNASPSVLQLKAEELKEARRKSRKASESKVRNIPPHLQLDHVMDPITGEVRYLRTWVVEHTSPKPTEAELGSPIQLFERYYKKSSALSFLDQMKPWFVGA